MFPVHTIRLINPKIIRYPPTFTNFQMKNKMLWLRRVNHNTQIVQ